MQPPAELLDRRFVLVTGKGGVGKSTVTAVLAHLSAEEGRRTLVCELNTRERIPQLFGHAPVGDRVTRISENIWSVNIRPASALEEYALMKIRFRALYHVVFENPLVQRFMEFVPGMNDLLLLGKAFNHEREVDGQGKPIWDRIIIDAPATGHGLTFLRLPRVIRDTVPAGNMHEEAVAMWDLLTDTERTVIHLVTLPEELPIQETRELHAALADELGLPLGLLFMNMVPPPLFDTTLREDFRRISERRPGDERLATLWEATHIRLAREALADHHAGRLDDLERPLVRLPLLYTEHFGARETAQLSDHARHALGLS